MFCFFQSDEFKYNKTQFILHAKETTEKYAMEHKVYICFGIIHNYLYKYLSK